MYAKYARYNVVYDVVLELDSASLLTPPFHFLFLYCTLDFQTLLRKKCEGNEMR